MPFAKGWDDRKENYANSYFATGGTVATSLSGEGLLNPIIVYSITFMSNGAANATLQLLNASTTADALTASANGVYQTGIASGATTLIASQQFPRGMAFSKGCTVLMTATGGSLSLTFRPMLNMNAV